MNRHAARRTMIPLTAAALVLAACSDDPDATPPSDPSTTDRDTVQIGDGDVQLTSALIPFGACDAVLDHVKAEALQRVGPYGFDGFGPWGPMPFIEGDVVMEAMEEDAAEETATADFGADDTASGAPSQGEGDGGARSEAPVEGVDFSGTNLQEEGVDEPDIVKTDGERIVTISDQTLTVVDVTGDAPRVVAQTRLEQSAREMFLVGDRLLVIGDGPGFAVPLDDVAIEPRQGEEDIAVDAVFPGPYWQPTVQVTSVDLGGDAITLGETIEMEGRYLSARIVDGTARIVLASSPTDLPFVYPQGEAGEETAEQSNRAVIESSTLDQWVPDFERRSAGGDVIAEGQLTDCTRMHRPTEFAGFDQLSVVGFDLGAGDLAPVDSTSVFANGETVYSSTEAMYVATNQWFDTFPVDLEQGWVEENYTTSFHKFSLGDDGTANYEASGSVRGHVLNQFSLDEHEGRLRVATTDGTPWGGGQEQSESFITVFEQAGDELVAAGSVGGLGKGERIFSVRFIDDEAYVVTFRQIDPFYVVDLSNPTQPAVVGELKIPGFSNYLHPLGDDLVLGVGQDATESGQTLGAKVSLFDVSDPANPTELAVWVDDGFSSSDVQWDHRAFTWWAPTGTAILPLSDWQSQFWGAVVLDVSRDGIVERGRVDQEDPDRQTGITDCLEIEAAGPEPTWETADDQLDYIRLEGGKIVACDPGTQGGPTDSQSVVSGYFCDGPIPADEWREWYGIPADSQVTAEPPTGSEIWFCWPDTGGDPVVRTTVIGDDLWTMSYRVLQQNDLATLDRGVRLPIVEG